jgi:hypothetical protein
MSIPIVDANSEPLDPEEEHERRIAKVKRLRENGDDEDRISFLHQERWISYPSAKKLLDRMEDLYSRPKRLRPRSMLVIARAGNGKTQLGRRFQMKHPPTDNREGDYIKYPVMYVQAPWKPNAARLFEKILSSLGVESATSASAARKERRALDLMKAVDTRMLMIDEVHHIISGSKKKHRQMLDLLKYISTELQIPIAALGTRVAAPAINQDEQTKTRFWVQALPKWTMNDKDSRQNYLRLLKSLEELLPLREPSNLVKTNLARKVLAMGEGRIGDIDEVVTLGAVEAIKRGKERITPELLDDCGWDPPSDQSGKAQGNA